MTANPANPTAANPLYTRLCEEYGCEYPIVAFSHTRDVVVAASNAGAIGMLGCSTHSMDELRADLAVDQGARRRPPLRLRHHPALVLRRRGTASNSMSRSPRAIASSSRT